ncbi:MAG: phosphate signaling complex protein PhoU [Treponema sp.]|jgi:phosphate transport system protein|nr:phosphate signaling complex protein PhoU [Treponema sp.]
MFFLESMNQVRHDILAMASQVEEDLSKAMSALRDTNEELAKEVKAADMVVNAMQLKIEDQVAILIATHQPVARHMRELVSIIKVAGNLERIGDYTVHIAKAAMKLSGEPAFRSLVRLERMAATSIEMLRASINAYLNQDAQAARIAAALDDRIDVEHKSLTEETLHLMQEHPELVKKAVRLLRTSGFLERLGDHITNICEGVIYMVESTHEELN